MGVLKFFRHIALKYDKCLIQLKGNIKTCEKISKKIDWLELDMNSIFHPVIKQAYSVPAEKHKSLLYPKKQQAPPKNINKEAVFKMVCDFIDRLIYIIDPQVGIYVAIDGVAGSSKQSQQRKRRFKSAEHVDGFDGNNLSCGTLYMDELSNYIRQYLISKKRKNFQIIYSDHHIVGEGEHKCIAHMRNNPQYSYVVVSPDADLIFLSLGLHNKNIFIFRENIFTDIFDCQYFLVDIDIFRNSLLNFINIDPTDNDAINDFIFFAFFIGNDFLPTVLSVNLSINGIENLLNIYNKVITAKGHLTTNRIINKSAFIYMLQLFAIEESDTILNNHLERTPSHPDKLLKSNIKYEIVEVPEISGNSFGASPTGISGDTSCSKRKANFNFDNYRKQYYGTKFDGIDPKVVCHEYFRGMIFVLEYYLNKIPSYDWCYPFLYAPFFIDMAIHLESFDINGVMFNESEPLTPLEQLVSILPCKSAYLLPEPLRILSSDKSPLIDMFPIDYDIDLDGKNEEYEGVIILPVVDIKRLKYEFNKLKPLLSKSDLKRNTPGVLEVF